MVITLFGLSGCGKSHLAERLALERGFNRICCDDLIEAKLRPELETCGVSSIAGVASWLGQPSSPGFLKRQQQYLDCEIESANEIIASLGDDGWAVEQNTVIDTSGSIVYAGDKILAALKRRSRIIYLGIPESEYDFMFQQYLADPKPVLWMNYFQPLPGESERETLARCYPQLIDSRHGLYRRYADVTLVMDRKARDNFSVLRLLRLSGAI